MATLNLIVLFPGLLMSCYVCLPFELRSTAFETCTFLNLNNCTQMKMMRELMASYGSNQYSIKKYNSWNVIENGIVGDGNGTGRRIRYHLCDGDTCRFYNTENFRIWERERAISIADGNYRIYGNVRRHNNRKRRNVVESCCDVNTTLVEVINVVNANDSNDVWNTTVGYENPTFVTRECSNPNSTCGDEEGVCTTIKDIHSVFAYQVDNSSNVEFRYLPVTFNVGCECRASP